LNYLDSIIILIVIIGFVLGYKDGLVRKVIGLFGLIAGIFLAFTFYEPVGYIIKPLLNNELQLAEIVAGILIFLLVMLIAAILKRVVHPLDKVSKFLNHFLGGLTGTIQMIFFLSAMFLLLNIFSLPDKTDRMESFSYERVYMVVPVTVDLIIGTQYETKKFFNDYIEGKDKFPFELDVDSLKSKVTDSLNTIE
jgi:membrane protein required for colicin V production